jgi:sec-independent protein translocase protein TatB
MHFGDTIFIFLLALVVFGPKKLPEIGRQIGKLMVEFRRASNDFKLQIEEELRSAEQADRQKALAAQATNVPTATTEPSIQPPSEGSPVNYGGYASYNNEPPVPIESAERVEQESASEEQPPVADAADAMASATAEPEPRNIVQEVRPNDQESTNIDQESRVVTIDDPVVDASMGAAILPDAPAAEPESPNAERYRASSATEGNGTISPLDQAPPLDHASAPEQTPTHDQAPIHHV